MKNQVSVSHVWATWFHTLAMETHSAATIFSTMKEKEKSDRMLFRMELFI